MSKQRIAIDIAEVMADSIARFQEWYGRGFQLELTLDALRGKNPHEAGVPEKRPSGWACRSVLLVPLELLIQRCGRDAAAGSA